MKLPKNILEAINILTGNGFEAYVVGGSVRDMIMGKTPADYDITTDALPEQTAKCFENYKVIETGIKHGTVTVVMDGENIEITTYRVDGEYLDNRRPENVSFTRSITEDLARRDFTMNAIAYNPKKGIVDPFDGEKDIKNGVIRCVGEADKRFCEDGLRILRAIRFASQTGFEIDSKTSASINENKNLIKNLSAERIFSEFKKLLCGEFAHEVINEYKEVIGVFIPEILPMIGFRQQTKYHCADVFSHTLQALKNCEKDEALRLSMFFHDIGKPDAYYADEDGTAHFKGHAHIGAEIAKNILTRLKVDNDTKNKVCRLVELHTLKIKTENDVKILVSRQGFELAKLLIKVKKADASAKAPGYTNAPELKEAEEIILGLEKSGQPLFLRDLAIGGDHLTKLGVSGKRVGQVLNVLLTLVITGELENNEDMLLNKAEEILKNEDV